MAKAGEGKAPIDGICRDTIELMDKVFTKDGINRGSMERAISISFDSTMIRDGCQYDLNKDFVGLDTTVGFEVLAQKFMKQVSLLLYGSKSKFSYFSYCVFDDTLHATFATTLIAIRDI